MSIKALLLAAAMLVSAFAPAMAQEGITVLDGAQDSQDNSVEGLIEGAAPGACGSRPMTIARMQWPSAAILAEIHALILAQSFGCQPRVVAGDLVTSTSSMATTGQPAVAPELWVTRVAEVWNQAIEAQALRPAGNSFSTQTFEGWYIPNYLAETAPTLTSATALATDPAFAPSEDGQKPRFISCPPDWGCSIINKNLLAALGLTERFEVVEPANRFEMDSLIANAVSSQENFVLYYWTPNAVLDQFGFTPLDIGAYEAEAFECLAQTTCASPQVSGFIPETVVVALAEWVFTEIPQVSGYFQRASISMEEMNTLLAALNLPGATLESVAAGFVAERADLWGPWVGQTP